MTEPKRVQIIRSNQNINEYSYQNNKNPQDFSYDQLLLNQKDYYTVGWKRLNTIQSSPLRENWPITIGNAIASFSSGFLG
jgi:hypothetical protein